MTNYMGDTSDINSTFGDDGFNEEDYDSDTEEGPGTHAKVAKLPTCNFCGKEAHYDFKTQQGPWAYGCTEDYEAFRLYQKLGTGMGQKLVVEA